jgi:hypothetical protein
MDIMGKLMVWPVVMMIGGIGVWGQASAPPPPCLAPPPQARAKNRRLLGRKGTRLPQDAAALSRIQFHANSP